MNLFHRICTAAVAVIILSSLGCQKKRAQSSNLPNVLIVLVDALRADHLPIYGSELDTAPFLSRWAKRGVIFENTYAQSSWTKSSVASLFTSRYVSGHGVFTSPDLDNPQRPFGERDVLSPHAVTLAEALQQRSYQTAAFTTNYHIVPMAGFRQGFDRFEIVDVDWMAHKAGDKVNAAFLGWLEDIDDDKPFFAYLHYMDVHGPYIPPDKYRDTFVGYYSKLGQHLLTSEEYDKLQYLKLEEKDLNIYIALYDAQILAWDNLFQNLMGELERKGLGENLIVIFMADHGEAFLEHDYFDHGYGLHVEELHVPLVFYCRKRFRPGRVGAPVQLIDVAPTILALAGAQAPRQFHGRNLAALLTGGHVPSAPIYSEIRVPNRADQAAMLDGGYKWIYDIGLKKIIAVYHVGRDPREEVNLVGDYGSGELEKMSVRFREWLAMQERNRIPPAPVPPNLRLDKKSIEALTALGYVK